MPDYNIYIHANSSSPASNPTTPWGQGGSNDGGQSNTMSASGSFEKEGASVIRTITKAAGYAQNPDSLIGTAITKIATVIPWVAAAYAVVKLGETVIDNVLDFSVVETGDYTGQVAWQNFKAATSVVFHPVSSVVQMFKTERKWARQNQRAKMERDLLGDSVINSYMGRGV